MLPAALMRPRQVLTLASVAFLLAVGVGVYFVVVSGLLLLPLLLLAAFCIVLYMPWILKTPWPEWSPGLGLGILPVLGFYFALSSEYTWAAAVAAVPCGFLVHNLLLLNEFPDAEADETIRRKTLPITAGKRGAAAVFTALAVAVYVWIIGAVAAQVMPYWCLLSLLTVPLAIKAIRGAFTYDDMARLIPAMGAHVMVVLGTTLLLGLGYILAAVF